MWGQFLILVFFQSVISQNMVVAEPLNEKITLIYGIAGAFIRA